MNAKWNGVLAMVAFVLVFGFMLVAAKAQPKIAAQGPHAQAVSTAPDRRKPRSSSRTSRCLRGFRPSRFFPPCSS
jgi:hypothetical protein